MMQQELGPGPAGGQGAWEDTLGTSGFPEALWGWTQTECPLHQGLPRRVQISSGYVNTGSFKRLSFSVINFQVYIS